MEKFVYLNNLYDNIKMVNEVNLKPIEEQINSINNLYKRNSQNIYFIN